MRKTKPKKRYLLPDPKFQDTLVTKFVNYLMEQGKKSVAYNIFYDAVAQVEKKTNEPGLEVWKRAMNNLMPAVEVKSRRVGVQLSRCRWRSDLKDVSTLASSGSSTTHAPAEKKQ